MVDQANDAVDDRDDDHDLHTGISCAHCGVLYDTDHVYVIHHHDCPYRALNPQLHSSMGDNLHVRDQSTSQLCIGEMRPHLLVFDSRDELVISGQ